MKKICAILLTVLYTTLSAFAQSQDHQHEDHDQLEAEVHAGHKHGQANIQIVQTATTFLFEIDFPAGDVKDHSEKVLNKIRNSGNIFKLDKLNDTCEMIKSKFEKKGLVGSHADYMMSFEFECTKPIKMTSIDLNPLFDLPTSIEEAKTHVIIGEQVLPPVMVKKKNAILRLKIKTP